MDEYPITKWHKWDWRNDIPALNFPGIYIVAKSDIDIADQSFAWLPEIIYIGMSNSKGGIKSRLAQFDKTLRGSICHGGADRVLHKYRDYNDLKETLYVSVLVLPCDVRSEKPEDLRLMGKVCSLEYECFAEFIERYGQLPEFNDQKRSPKFSKGH